MPARQAIPTVQNAMAPLGAGIRAAGAAAAGAITNVAQIQSEENKKKDYLQELKDGAKWTLTNDVNLKRWGKSKSDMEPLIKRINAMEHPERISNAIQNMYAWDAAGGAKAGLDFPNLQMQNKTYVEVALPQQKGEFAKSEESLGVQNLLNQRSGVSDVPQDAAPQPQAQPSQTTTPQSQSVSDVGGEMGFGPSAAPQPQAQPSQTTTPQSQSVSDVGGEMGFGPSAAPPAGGPPPPPEATGAGANTVATAQSLQSVDNLINNRQSTAMSGLDSGQPVQPAGGPPPPPEQVEPSKSVWDLFATESEKDRWETLLRSGDATRKEVATAAQKSAEKADADESGAQDLLDKRQHEKDLAGTTRTSRSLTSPKPAADKTAERLLSRRKLLATLSDRTKLMDDDVRAQLIQEVQTEISQLSEGTEFETSDAERSAPEWLSDINSRLNVPNVNTGTVQAPSAEEKATMVVTKAKEEFGADWEIGTPGDSTTSRVTKSIQQFGLDATVKRLLERR